MLKIRNEPIVESQAWDLNKSEGLIVNQPFIDNFMPMRKSLQPLSEHLND